MCEELVSFNRDGCSRAVRATHVVRNVFGEANGLDWGASEVSSADEAAAKVEKDFWRPGPLGVSSVPERIEEPLTSC